MLSCWKRRCSTFHDTASYLSAQISIVIVPSGVGRCPAIRLYTVDCRRLPGLCPALRALRSNHRGAGSGVRMALGAALSLHHPLCALGCSRTDLPGRAEIGFGLAAGSFVFGRQPTENGPCGR